MFKKKEGKQAQSVPPGNPAPKMHWDGYVYHFNGNMVLFPGTGFTKTLPYKKVGDFNEYGYAAVSEEVDGETKYGLVRFCNGGTDIEDHLPPSADEFSLGGGVVKLMFGNNKTQLTLHKVDLPSGGRLASSYSDPLSLTAAVHLLSPPTP